MSIFRRLLGGASEQDAGSGPAPDAVERARGSATGSPGAAADRSAASPDADTAAVLEEFPPERARYLAAAAYVLARVTNADLAVSPEETSFMERTLVAESGIAEAEAVLVVEAAKQQARLFGSTEDYLVTREFKLISESPQRLRLLRACFMAAASDGSISSAESATLDQVASELDLDTADLAGLRTEFADRLSVVQAMRAARGAETPPTDTPRG